MISFSRSPWWGFLTSCYSCDTWSIKVKLFWCFFRRWSSLCLSDDATFPHSLPNGANCSSDKVSQVPCVLSFFFIGVFFRPCVSNALPRSTPNKSGWVVYHKRSNVNLAKPAAIAVVWRGMRVITQTDRHKHTQTAGDVQSETHTVLLF